MFGRRRPITFDPYARKRGRRGLPRWAWLLLFGLVAGAGGVLLIQEHYLPPRLSASESARLREDYARADADRQRLTGELAAAQGALKRAEDARAEAASAAAEGRERAAHWDADLAFVIDGLPPDPRPGQVAVRAADFSASQGLLRYVAALSRPGKDGVLPVVLQVVVLGRTAQGDERSVALQPVPLKLSRQAVVRGDLPLPEGFRPRQATLRLLAPNGGAQLGMRVLKVD
jgi:hypothetical protein